MVQLQLLSRVLNTHDDSIITDNLLTEEHFTQYREEFKFIEEHKEKYGNIPDIETFLAHFPTIELFSVTESDKYLVETIKEEYLYTVSVPILHRFEELLRTDSNQAAEYLASQMHNLQPNYYIDSDDIIAQADERYNEFLDRKSNEQKWFIETGFPELDDILGGLQRGEDLITIFARLGVGKSWFLEKIAVHTWKIGYNVGYFSPEMSKKAVGFRFDTLLRNFNNRALMRGRSEVDEKLYRQYIDELKSRGNKFAVTTPAKFDRNTTITKLRNWVKQDKLDVLCIDGVKYLKDERGRKNDNTTTTLTNISEDLMELSCEMEIPVVIVHQANRNGVAHSDGDDTPEADDVSGSDGILQNSSRGIALATDGNILKAGIKKNRYGEFGDTLCYAWDKNTGVYTFLKKIEKQSRSTRASSKADVSIKPTGSRNHDVF